MTTPDPMDDELLRLYRRASAQDPRRPAPRVDAAIRAHARMLASAGQGVLPDAGSNRPAAAPANHSYGLRAMLASVAVMGLMGLLFLQFDRATPQENELAQGVPQPAETGPARLTPRPRAEQAIAPVAADAAPAPDAPVLTQQSPPPRAQAQAQASANANANANAKVAPVAPVAPIARMTDPATTGEGLALSGESVAPRMPMNRAGVALPDAPSNIAREGDVTAQTGKALADSQQAARMKLSVPAPASASAVRPDTALASATPPLAIVGDNALLALARSGQVAKLDVLLASGLAIDTHDAAGRTPLMEAAARGHADMVSRLLARGANRQLRDLDGKSAAQLARAAGYPQLADLIDTGS